MSLLLPFSPFIVFALAERFVGVVAALFAAAVVSIVLLVRDRVRGEPDVNVLEAGSAVMFLGLGLAALAGDAASWSLWRVRLGVDGGLLLIVVLGLLMRRPFSLHQGRHEVSAEVARSAAFLRTNMIVSSAWAVAFAGLVAVDALMVMNPATAPRVGVVLTAAALAAAFGFTRWYAERVSRRAAARRLAQGMAQ